MASTMQQGVVGRAEWLAFILRSLGFHPDSLEENREVVERVWSNAKLRVTPGDAKAFRVAVLEQIDEMMANRARQGPRGDAKAAVSDEAVFSPDQIAALHRMIDNLKQ